LTDTREIRADPKEVRFTPSAKVMGYLRRLAQDTLLGSTVNEVALMLLTVELERRLLADYHLKIVPTIEPREGGGTT
jgi:hypothetical protein